MPERATEAPLLEPLLAPGRKLQLLDDRIQVAPGVDDLAARYDRHASAYDRLIGSRLYNGLFWGTNPAAYSAFAHEAVASDDGLLLDVGGGTAVFTASAYRAAGRPVVLTDVSAAMLGRAAARLGRAPVALLQADLYDLPFEPNRFATVACFTMLHVLDRPWEALAALRGQLAPGGSLFASMLVDDRLVGRAYMRVLRAAGEFGPPRSSDELLQVARQTFGEQMQVDVERTGSVAWLRVTPA